MVDANTWLLPFAILLPLVGGLFAFLLPRAAAAIGSLTSLANLGVVSALVRELWQQGAIGYSVGGWGAPLGIDLLADGPATVMLLVTAIVSTLISISAVRYFGEPHTRSYWPLWLFLITSLNALFLSRDLFNLYVTLELLGLSAVGLTALEGGRKPLVAALRYLFAGLAGSLIYLLGVALVYHSTGSVEITATEGFDGPAAHSALVLMTVGLLVKGALFPFHFWLPAAHGSAPAPVSAALSALVLKGAFFILIRVWLEVFPTQSGLLFVPLSWLGGAAVLWGSLQAVLQTRVKLLIAYSSVAQIGYLFLALPLVRDADDLWAAIILLGCAHAFAKSALFIASLGRGDELEHVGQSFARLPTTAAAIGIAAISIMGLPPSGGFSAKWLLLESAIGQQHWAVVTVLILGGLLAVAYAYRLVAPMFETAGAAAPEFRLPAGRQLPALLLALLSLALGFAAEPWLELTTAGSVFSQPAAVP